MKKLIISFLVMSSVITACKKEKSYLSEDLDQNDIRVKYSSSYIEEANETSVNVVFTENNKAKPTYKLSEPAEILVNGEALDYDSEMGFYKKTFPGLVNILTWSYTDLNDQTYENTIEMEPIGFSQINSIDINNDFTLSWTGNAIDEDEYVKVLISQDESGFHWEQSSNNIGATSITVAKNRFDGLNEGSAKLFIYRSLSSDGVNGTAAAGLISRYYSASPITVQIVN